MKCPWTNLVKKTPPEFMPTNILHIYEQSNLADKCSPVVQYYMYKEHSSIPKKLVMQIGSHSKSNQLTV